MTAEVRKDSKEAEYYLYKVQEDCDFVFYRLVQDDRTAEGTVICLLQVRMPGEAGTETKPTVEPSGGCFICSEQRKSQKCDCRALTKPYECDTCKKTFTGKKQIRRHVKSHWGDGGRFVCDVCGKTLMKEDYYRAHMRTHSGDLTHECEKCGKKFSSGIGLSIHKSHNCLKNCDDCNRSFQSGEPVCVHLKRKKAEEQKAKYVPRGMRKKTKACPHCGKLFLFNSEVKLHVTVSHTGEKKFVCEECGKCFKTQKCFQLHRRIHNDFRPYLCTFCEKRFKTLNHIKQHIRTHTGEKPYCCPLCGRGFAQSGDMKKHLLKIHDFTYDQIKYKTPGNEKAGNCPVRESYDNPEGNGNKRRSEQEDETLTYGETQVNLIRANIFKKQTVNTPFKRWFKCTHCLTMFSTKASLTRHLKRFNCKEESREFNFLSYLSLNEIKEAIYGSKYKKKQEEKNAVPVIHETGQSQAATFAPEQPEKKEAEPRPPETEPEVLLNCEFCSKTFTQKRTLNAHMTTHQRQQHLCPICGKQFSYKSSLVSHQVVHQKLPKSHVCGKCNAAFTTVRSLRRHYYTHYNYRDKEFICELCGKRFAYSMTLKNHKLSHSEERPHVCRICGTSFKRTTHLRTHEQGVHGLHDGALPKKYTCAICQKSMVRKESLEAHMKEHTGELNFQCGDCHKKFTTNTGLNIHVAMGRCHPFVKSCNLCSKEFKGDDPVCEHLKSKTGKRRQVRTRHKRESNEWEKQTEKKCPVPRHLKERNYYCKVCGKHYIYPCELKTHFRLAHTDEKPFVCGRCGKAFKTKASLQMHEDVHNDLRPYKCDICEKRFRKSEHVKLHIRTHTGEKPHVCDVCGRGFAQKGDMKKHILKTHNKALPQQQNAPVGF